MPVGGRRACAGQLSGCATSLRWCRHTARRSGRGAGSSGRGPGLWHLLPCFSHWLITAVRAALRLLLSLLRLRRHAATAKGRLPQLLRRAPSLLLLLPRHLCLCLHLRVGVPPSSAAVVGWRQRGLGGAAGTGRGRHADGLEVEPLVLHLRASEE